MVLACGSNDFGQCGSEHPGDQPASANFEMGMLRALQFGIICKAIHRGRHRHHGRCASFRSPPARTAGRQHGRGAHLGSGTYGKLGHGDERDRHIPEIVKGHPATPVPAFAAVSAGAQHTLALSGRGELYAWGRNTEGQCGIALKKSETLGWRAEALAESRPRRVVEFFEQPRWYHQKGAAPYGKYGEPLQEKIFLTQISAGHNHSAALASDGSVFMFGRGNKGQVGRIALAPLDGLQGLQGRYDSPVPIRVGGALRGVKVVEVACGGEHTLARTATGHTYAWGAGLHGQLGLGRFALMVTEPTLIEAEVLDPGVAEVRRGVEAQGDTLATLDLAGSGLRRIVSTVRRVEESFIAYAVVACLAVFLPVALGVPWGGNAEARVYLGEYLGWN